MDQEIKEQKVYELGYLLVPTLPEPAVGGEVSAIKDVLEKNGASFISEEAPLSIDLAYTITKSINNKNYRYDVGYFGWIKFESTPDAIEKLNKEIEKNNSIIRFLIVKTVRENTTITKRIARKARVSDDYSEGGDIEEVPAEEVEVSSEEIPAVESEEVVATETAPEQTESEE